MYPAATPASEGTAHHRMSAGGARQGKIKPMRTLRLIFAGFTLAAVAAFAADSTPVPPAISCGNGIPGGVRCFTSKGELKQARNAYARGLKLEERSRLDEARRCLAG